MKDTACESFTEEKESSRDKGLRQTSLRTLDLMMMMNRSLIISLLKLKFKIYVKLINFYKNQTFELCTAFSRIIHNQNQNSNILFYQNYYL